MITVAIAAVVALAAFAVCATVLTTIATGHPERAATIVVVGVVGVAVGAAGLVGIGLLVLGLGTFDISLNGAARHHDVTVDIDSWRATVGLATAGVLLATAFRLVRTGDWAHLHSGEESGR